MFLNTLKTPQKTYLYTKKSKLTKLVCVFCWLVLVNILYLKQKNQYKTWKNLLFNIVQNFYALPMIYINLMCTNNIKNTDVIVFIFVA